MIKVILLLLVLIVCVITTITDMRTGKIPNKVIIIFGLLGIFLVVCFYAVNTSLFYLYVINLFIVFGLGFGMFSLNIWGAGDAKLWILITFLFPYDCYKRMKFNIFPSANILVLVFSIAYVYVLGETIVKLAMKRNGKLFHIDVIKNIKYSEYIYFFSLILAYYRLNQYFFRQYYEQNQVLFVVIAIMILSKIQNIKIGKRNMIAFSMCNFILIFVVNIISANKFDINQIIISLCIVIISNLVRLYAAVFNYTEIPTKEVKKGMILSISTVMEFQMSRVKGLPHTTDETTKSRITEDEVNAILRWEKSKMGKETIVVVEHMPFAIFFMLGILLYILM